MYIEDIIEQTTFEDYDGSPQHTLMFFIDYDRGTSPVTYHKYSVQEDSDSVFDTLVEVTKTTKLTFIAGAVCFKHADLDIDLVEMLTKYDHCGCFGTEPIFVASFKTKNGKTVLYKRFDTESG